MQVFTLIIQYYPEGKCILNLYAIRVHNLYIKVANKYSWEKISRHSDTVWLLSTILLDNLYSNLKISPSNVDTTKMFDLIEWKAASVIGDLL